MKIIHDFIESLNLTKTYNFELDHVYIFEKLYFSLKKNVDSRAFSHSSRNDKLQSASSKPHHTAVPIDINDMHPSKTSSFLHQQQPKKDHDYRSSPPHKKMFIDHHSGNHDHTDNNKSASKVFLSSFSLHFSSIDTYFHN